jgi:hypothetical protein
MIALFIDSYNYPSFDAMEKENYCDQKRVHELCR